MRVNPNPLPDLLAALQQTQQQINTDLQQISSGQSVIVPSDDPGAAAELVQNAAQTSAADQFLRSIGSVQGEVANADSTLSSITTALQRAISLGVEAANGTLNASDRAAIATEVQGIQSQLVSLANLSYQGSYVFAGTATQTVPYVGNSSTNSITLGNHFTLQTNVPGSQLFSAAGNDMFQSIQDLLTGLQTGTGIAAAVGEVTSAANYLDAQRVFYGNASNQLTAQQTYLNSDITALAEQQNTLGGADLATAITNLTSAETAHQATLAAVAGANQPNLFSYIK